MSSKVSSSSSSKYERRGSVPSASSSSHKSSSRKTADKEKRYPVPIPYQSVIEMDQIFGDMRSSKHVATYAAAQSSSSKGGKVVSTGRPHVGSDGRMWRDRDEELEYSGLLASPFSSADSYRRGSDQTITAADVADMESSKGDRRHWAKFGRAPARGTTYDALQASERRMRAPNSATSSSASEDDEEDWSPLADAPHATHQFPAYSFPQPSKSSRASSNTSSSRVANDFAAMSLQSSSSRDRSRPPTTTTSSSKSGRRSSMQAVGSNEIVVPLPSLVPQSESRTSSKEKSGFLGGVFRKK